eukprot:COSAG06_NODE_5019_length_3787_cov_1.600054_4_plen_67_part_00
MGGALVPAKEMQLVARRRTRLAYGCWPKSAAQRTAWEQSCVPGCASILRLRIFNHRPLFASRPYYH